MYFHLQPIDLSKSEGIDELIKKLISEQITTDAHQWNLFQKFEKNKRFLEEMDGYQLCNFRIIYEILGFKEVPAEMYLYFGHVMRYIVLPDKLSPLQQKYAELVMDVEIDSYDGFGEDSIFDFHARVDELIQLIKGF